jgi:hypothetical protein
MDWWKDLYERFEHSKHLRASIVRDMFHAIIGPALKELDFERVKEDVWLRSASAEIEHVISLAALKGLSHEILLGVRLSFVPRVSQRSVRNHTPSESAWEMLDLVHSMYAENEYNPIEQLIGAGHGYRYLRKDLKRQLKVLIPYAKSFFKNADSLNSVLDMYEAEKVRDFKGLGFTNYRRHDIAYPFLLARLGNLTAAERIIEKNLDSLEVTESVRERVMNRLQSVAEQPAA